MVRNQQGSQKRTVVRRVFNFIPLGFMFDRFREAGQSLSNVVSTAKAATATAKQRASAMEESDPEYERLSPRQRFERAAREGGWTPEGIAWRTRQVRITKWLCTILSVAILCFFLYAAVSVKLLWVIFLAPVCFAGLLGMSIQVFRHAWFDFQLRNRVEISMKDFISRSGMWRWFIN